MDIENDLIMSKASSHQPKWDIFEAAVLLNGYLEMKKGIQPKSHIVKRISSDLRRMAINRAIQIDDVYRNENGISYQIQSMDSAYKGVTVYVPATKLFDEAVDLYRKDIPRYNEILREAKSMIQTEQNNRDAFLSWVTSVLPSRRHKWVEENILKMEQLAIASKLITGSIFAVSDTAVLEAIFRAARKNKIFQIKNRKLINNINEDFMSYLKFCSLKSETEKNSVKPEVKAVDSSDGSVGSAQKEAAFASSACEKEFFDYLRNVAHLADRTCSSYVSSIRSAERYAAENGYESCYLFSEDGAMTLATASELYSDSDFIRYNEQQHNRFSAAINKLLESIGAEIPPKAVASIDTVPRKVAAPTEANSEIVSVLKEHYEYGFKYDSIRELMRFRQFADGMGISLPDDDNELKASILSAGTVIEDKVYCKSDDMPLELQRIVDDIFSSGVGVVYYESLFENEQSWMESHVITSAEMLKEYLQQNITGCSFSKRFMINGTRVSEREAVTDELKRVWGTSPSVSVYELQNRLPYIPLGNIWRVISGNDSFVLTSEGEYLLIDLFRISEDETEDILDFVEGACEENGFASLTDVPLGDIEEENYELTQLAIYNAIYKKVLFGKYHINGKILTKEKTELDAVTLLKQYIKGKDECSFDEVAEKVVELTGGTNRQYAFQALYDDMVRVDKNRFVANRFVSFNVDEIDSVLSGFISEHFRAIRDVTTFAMFPLCGQSWNHYLLESFCYKYSKKFSLHVIHFNDKNAGIITEKDYNKSYNDMLAVALARMDVELSEKTVGQYLFDTGYMAKSKYAKLNEIAQRASELRKER